MSDPYAAFPNLRFDRPADGVLRVTLDGPNLNAVDHAVHRELADVWLAVDRDADTRVALLTGAGKALSAGGSFDLIDDMVADYAVRTRVLREARDIVLNTINCSKPIVSAIHGSAVGAGLAAALMADISIAAKSARLIDGHTRLGLAAGDHAAMIWPLLCGMAKAKYHVLTCEAVSGEEAERIGLVSLCVPDDALTAKSEEVAARLATGAQRPIRWSKYAMNNWLRMAGPIFDNSAALELLTFNGPEVREGLASLKEKRPPNFDYKV
jgi:enoyl-CoA hydratase